MQNLIKKWTLVREAFMFDNAARTGLVKPFNDKLYDRLKNYCFAGIPLNIQVKYCVPNGMEGKCDIRARYLMFAFDNATLVKGNKGCLEVLFGKDKGEHWWVEDETSVYDPTSLLEYDKDFYYRLNRVKDVKKFSEEDLLEDPYIKKINNSSYEDLLPGGKSRFDLLERVPLFDSLSCTNPDLAKDLEAFKQFINYDYLEIMEELQKALNLK